MFVMIDHFNFACQTMMYCTKFAYAFKIIIA